jgi:hypothetical protein
MTTDIGQWLALIPQLGLRLTGSIRGHGAANIVFSGSPKSSDAVPVRYRAEEGDGQPVR